MPDESLEKLRGTMQPRDFSKRSLLVSEGSLTRCAFFIAEGMTRSYWVVDGEEITTSFSTEGALVFSMDELYYGRPSEEYVEAIEDLRAYAVPLPELHRLLCADIHLATWFRIIHQEEYRRLHRSHKERLTLPAAERYEAFRQQFPDVCRRANLSYIASYLGINPSTLSRLRKKF